ncbi:MAG: septum formation protein Maf [Bacteroidales bacterium]|nr:septum formation protein Maf [Bacteroidales bacterium]
MKLLLASKSPRRRQLLSQLGYPIDYITLDTDEHISSPLPAAEVAEYLARRKAAAYPTEKLKDDEVLVTADTVVVHNGQVLGKPATRDDAVAMLHNLSGDKHTVYTGVCLRSIVKDISFTESTDVYFRHLTDKDIDYYVDNYRPYDKAGAYGIQEWIGMVGVSRIEGCYYNVMGLPVARLYERLSSIFESR